MSRSFQARCLAMAGFRRPAAHCRMQRSRRTLTVQSGMPEARGTCTSRRKRVPRGHVRLSPDVQARREGVQVAGQLDSVWRGRLSLRCVGQRSLADRRNREREINGLERREARPGASSVSGVTVIPGMCLSARIWPTMCFLPADGSVTMSGCRPEGHERGSTTAEPGLPLTSAVTRRRLASRDPVAGFPYPGCLTG